MHIEVDFFPSVYSYCGLNEDVNAKMCENEEEWRFYRAFRGCTCLLGSNATILSSFRNNYRLGKMNNLLKMSKSNAYGL